MPGDEGSSDGSGTQSQLTRAQVLDELRHLASVEHALVVDYLHIHYALGGDLDPEPGSGATGDRLFTAAQEAFSIALSEMGHFRDVNGVLVLAGQEPMLHGASQVLPASGPAIGLGRFAPAQFARFPERERAIAAAVDDRWARLRTALPAPASLFEGDLLDAITSLLAGTTDHAGAIDALAGELTGLVASDHLRASRTEPANEVDRVLLALSDRYYGVLVKILGARFEHDEEVGGQLRGLAVLTMDRLNDANRMLIRRGLVPPFTVFPVA